MGYREVRRESKRAILIDQYVTAKYGAPGKRRSKRSKATPEDMKRVNAWQKRRKCLWRLQLYFDPGDYYITLTYRKDERPADMAAAKKDFKQFLEKLRRSYKKMKIDFRWIRNIEIGKRKACHVHMILKRMEGLDLIIRKLWTKGKVDFQLLYEDGAFKDLAAYITKSEITDKTLSETDYQASRNMPLPEPKVKEIRGWTITRKISVPQGWSLDADSVMEGINPLTGYKYRSYMLIRCG